MNWQQYPIEAEEQSRLLEDTKHKVSCNLTFKIADKSVGNDRLRPPGF